jgi:hypothetical protein
MKPSRQFIVYLIGVCLLGLFYQPVKAALGGDWLFVVCVFAYLVVLRLLGKLVTKGRSERVPE